MADKPKRGPAVVVDPKGENMAASMSATTHAKPMTLAEVDAIVLDAAWTAISDPGGTQAAVFDPLVGIGPKPRRTRKPAPGGKDG